MRMSLEFSDKNLLVQKNLVKFHYTFENDKLFEKSNI